MRGLTSRGREYHRQFFLIAPRPDAQAGIRGLLDRLRRSDITRMHFATAIDRAGRLRSPIAAEAKPVRSAMLLPYRQRVETYELGEG